uniref:SAYSvFN domain-containing protein n=1 Tax=Graphocephala atropunctata TaxID=36148 RepID=A0A1B6MAL2_9HEMI
MDRKLAEYRAQKKREELIKVSKEKIYSIFINVKQRNKMSEGDKSKDEGIEIENDRSSNSSDGETSSADDDNQCCDELTFSKISLYFSLWLILFSFAVYLEFGAVYFILSLMYIIWTNTRTGPKKRGEVSAYSVFNPNCEAIDGTLKAEQFEKEIRYGVL